LDVAPKTIPAELLVPRIVEQGFWGFGRKVEPLEKTAKRLEGLVNKAYAPAFEATKAVAFQNDRIRELERQNNQLKRELENERKLLAGLTPAEKKEWVPSLLEAVAPHINEARENARKAEEQRVRELDQWVKAEDLAYRNALKAKEAATSAEVKNEHHSPSAPGLN
jgi:5-carboxymethyl-2-hydroxymuconate isomerase